MSGSTLPKAVLASPSQEERIEDASLVALRSSRYFEIVRTNAETSLQDMHQARIKALRKELDFFKESKWKYETIDKYIGQSSQ